MATLSLRIPLKWQVGVVVVLFVAALTSLWLTSTSVIERERRRATAKGVLDRAGTRLAEQGTSVIARAPRWPDYIGPADWDQLDRELSAEAARALAPFEGVEGGYYVRDFTRFVGTAVPANAPPRATPKDRRGGTGPPSPEAELIEIQIDAAIRKDQSLFVVEISEPDLIAIRTAPIAVRGQMVAATWTMIRLEDPLFMNRSLRGYQLTAGLALGGIALSLLWMAGLARTVRRQALERERLQTELRRSERLAALGKLLAGVAHEVRNPLAGIRSTVQLWQRGIGPDAESFEGLVDEVDRLEGIVARLLHFSRADAQDMMPSNLNDVVAEVARLAQPNADDLGVIVELDLAPDLPPNLMAPPALIQVFRNLSTNALQAMPGGGTLRFSTRADVAAGEVIAQVADSGPGLSPEALNHLFEPFYTTKPGGTGLGLAIAREIVLAHRGELRADPSDNERGARFILSLPILRENGHEGKPGH